RVPYAHRAGDGSGRASLENIVHSLCQKLCYTSDRMESLATAVINHFGKAPEGVPVAAKELLHLGTRAAVDQTLSRLVRSGSLIRVSRGLYVRPIQGRFGVRPPEPATLVNAIAEQRGESVVPHGAAAANELGLTTQVPVREVYLTSGPTR